ncbi:MAG: hypothetical protein IKH04_02845 [Kiritimatiellae bacterium]|nr:hypothetical protein [Kiritimatiellia bacterium]
MKASHIQKSSLWTLAGVAWTVTILCSISAFAQDKFLIEPPRQAVREAVQMETAPGRVPDALRELERAGKIPTEQLYAPEGGL